MRNKAWICTFLMAAVLVCGCDKDEQEVPVEQEQATVEQELVSVEQEQLQTEIAEQERNIVSIEKNKVKLETSMGDIVIELNKQAAPGTAKNFLDYVESGFYDGTIFHRIISDFMIQGGGFTAEMVKKQPGAPIKNEFQESNLRGTIAMAKLGGNPDSATCQFFINLGDNSRNLDNQNGGFTVFGKVIDGMDVVDAIALVKTTTKMGMGDVPVEPVVVKSAKVVLE